MIPKSAVVSRGVKLGKGTQIGNYVILGQATKDKKFNTLTIGPEATLRPFTVIYMGSKIGARFATGHYSVIRENNSIGDDVSVGITAELGPGNVIGDRVRIHSGCFLEWTTIGNDVFIGPNTVFLDDPHPMCPRYLECVKGAKVGNQVSFGGNVTVLPGVGDANGAPVVRPVRTVELTPRLRLQRQADAVLDAEQRNRIAQDEPDVRSLRRWRRLRALDQSALRADLDAVVDPRL